MQDKITVYISLGSNIDPHRHIGDAFEHLKSLLCDPVMSPIYQSPAVGMSGDDFLNAVVAGHTLKTMREWLNVLRQLESDAGRVRTENKFVDRTLDLDLLLYGNTVCTAGQGGATVTLPHPEIVAQAYVLQPLTDIAGDFFHPTAGATISALYRQLKQQSPEMFLPLQRITLLSD